MPPGLETQTSAARVSIVDVIPFDAGEPSFMGHVLSGHRPGGRRNVQGRKA
jgi:hypothetical protein